VWVDAWRG